MSRCPKCDNQVQEGDVHCYNCGVRLHAETKERLKREDASWSELGGKFSNFASKNKTALIITVSLVVIALVFMLLYPRPNITFDVVSYPAELEPNEAAIITVNVENSGRAGGLYSFDFLLNEEIIESREIFIESSDKVTVTFPLPDTLPAGNNLISINEWEREIEKLKAAELVIEQLSLEPNPVGTGEELTVNATLVNVGDVDGSFDIAVKLDGEVVEIDNIEVKGNLSIPYKVITSIDAPGTYELSLNDIMTEKLEVLNPADIRVSGLNISPSSVETGKSSTVSVEVSNYGDIEGSHRVSISIDGTEEQSETVKVKGNSSEDVTFKVSKDSSGRYTVSSEGYSKTLTVQSPVSQAPATEPPASATSSIDRPSNGFIITRDMAIDRGNAEFSIVNALNQDVVFVVTSRMLARPLLAVYVRANGATTVYNIPDGKYTGYFATGQNWDKNSNRFTRNVSHYKYMETMDISSGYIYRMMIAPSGGWQKISSGDFPHF